MTCREVDRALGRRLDSVRLGANPPDLAGPLPPELEEHLARCPSCRSRSAGYAALSQAIGGLGPPPTPSPSLSSRILAELRADPTPEPRVLPIRRGRAVARWLAASAAVALVVLGLRAMRPGPAPVSEPEVSVSIPEAMPESPRSLTVAVVEAAEAAEAIARKTSGPATRIGRDVFGGKAVGDETAAVEVEAEAEPSAPGQSGGTAERVVTLIGNGFEAGVRPLSTPTRSAFGFLLPSLPRADDPPPADRGA